MASSSDLVGRAFGLGWRRVFTAPTLLLGLWLVALLGALPAAWTMKTAITEHVGSSLVASRIAAVPDEGWWGEFLAHARGAALTLQPDIIGAAAPVSNLSQFLDAPGVPRSLVATVGLGLLAWFFLTGGVIDRYARGRRLGSRVFFGACGVFFFRFLRLGLLAGLAYALLLGPVHEWLFETAYPWMTREISVERTAFLWRVTFYAIWLAPVLLVNLVVDYAKVRAVVEDRHSVIGAVVAAARFIIRHPAAVAAVYAANAAIAAVVLLAYILIAPDGRGGDWRLLVALAVGGAYLLARLAVRLAFLTSAMALLERTFAHAEYTAPPLPVWPDSPAAEAIENAAVVAGRQL